MTYKKVQNVFKEKIFKDKRLLNYSFGLIKVTDGIERYCYSIFSNITNKTIPVGSVEYQNICSLLPSLENYH